MPSLNCKTRKLTYTAADERAVNSAITLCVAVAEFDNGPVKKHAEEAGKGLGVLLAHIEAERYGVTSDPAPKPKQQVSGWKGIDNGS